MRSDLEEIKSRLNIVDVLGEYIRLEKAGSNFRALCPFHNEKSPSFMVSEEKQIWHCFGCQKGGDIFGFVMEIEGLEFRDALKMLAEKAGIKLVNFSPKKAEEKNRTLEILELATKWYEHQLWNGPGKTKILNYLHERGLKDETIKEFRLGYAPKGWRNILTFLTKREYKLDEIKKTGLLVEKGNSQLTVGNLDKNSNYKLPITNYYDRFRERIMFPIADYSGKVVGFSARVTPGADESQAKYVNTPETEVYHKSRILYGIDKARGEIRGKDYALLVEGNMDVIAAHQAGLKGAVAVSGTALTADQLDILKRYTKNMKMFFDMDSAGELATKKSMKLCFSKDMNVDIISLPFGKDAADVSREDPEKLVKAVEKSTNAMDYIFSKTLSKFDKDNVNGKKNITEEIIDMINSLTSPVEKSHWIKKLGELVDVSETALTDMLKKINLRNRISGTEKDDKKETSVINRKKIEILIDELISLALVSSEAWRKLEQEKKNYAFLPKDSLLSLMLKKGPELGFDFDKLTSVVKEVEIKERAEKLFFNKKFRLSLNNELEEVEIASPEKELEELLMEIKKESKKEELEKIISDLKLAEKNKDKEAINFLRLEFKRISNESAELS